MSCLLHAVGEMDWFGLDLDHTLVKYRLPALLPHIYACLGATLLRCGRDASGGELLPRDALTSHPFDAAFCSRGLVFDTRTGDLLRLSTPRGRVCAARHGYTGALLTADEVQIKYGVEAWRDYTLLLDTGKAPDALVCSTFFDSPAIQLLALMVDQADAKSKRDANVSTLPLYAHLLPPLFEAFGENFDPPSFASGRGGYFRGLRENPSKFVVPRPELRAALDSLRSAKGTRVAVVTNSDWDYANMLLEAAFGIDWRTSFDLCVYRAKKKRGFYTSDAPFEPFDLDDTNVPPEAKAGRDKGSILEFCGGNATELQSRLLLQISSTEDGKKEARRAKGQPVTMVYCGDDLWGDAELVRRFTAWRTIGVVDELAADVLERGCYQRWGGTTALSCADGAGVTLLGDLAGRCDFCCADLADLLVPTQGAVALPTPMRTPHTAKASEMNTSPEQVTESGTPKTSSVDLAKENATAHGDEGVLINVVSRTGRPLLAFRMPEPLLRSRSQFCRAALDWPNSSKKKDSISITVDPPSLAPYVEDALDLDGHEIDDHSNIQLRRPLTGSSDGEDEDGAPYLDVVALKVLCEQLGLNALEVHVDQFLEEDVSPQTAMAYLTRASELQPYGELTQACLALAARTAAEGSTDSDHFLSSCRRGKMPSSVLVHLMEVMRDWHGAHERVRQEYARAFLLANCGAGRNELEKRRLDLDQVKAIMLASGAIETRRFDPNRHPVVQAARRWCRARFPSGSPGAAVAHLEDFLRCNFARAKRGIFAESSEKSSVDADDGHAAAEKSKDEDPADPVLALEDSASPITNSPLVSEVGVVVGTLDAPAAGVFEAYANLFNHVAVRKGWRVLPFTLADVANPIFAPAARHVSRIRAQLDEDSTKAGTRGFTMRKIGGCSWDYLFALKAGDVLGSSGTARRRRVVRELVKATLRDGSGYVEGLTSARIDALVDGGV